MSTLEKVHLLALEWCAYLCAVAFVLMVLTGRWCWWLLAPSAALWLVMFTTGLALTALEADR